VQFWMGMNREELSDELKELVRKRAQDLSQEKDKFYCRIDADCPAGFVCVGGLCVPQAV
jgi:hypothetical protein